ncbi:MAG: ABC transporter permease [Blastocatellia bacterium]|nr:ABC transporter permease [Blastocatellia bacterium]
MRVQAGLGETIRMALRNIWERKLRSSLTLLGIIVGTTTVIVIGSILTGMSQRVDAVTQSFGTSVLLVSKYDSVGPRFRDMTADERSREDLTYGDVEAIDASRRSSGPVLRPCSEASIRLRLKSRSSTAVWSTRAQWYSA